MYEGNINNICNILQTILVTNRNQVYNYHSANMGDIMRVSIHCQSGYEVDTHTICQVYNIYTVIDLKSNY